MSILRISDPRRMTLGLAFVGALVLAGCEGGGGSEAALADVKDGAKGKEQAEARRKAFGPTGNPPAGKSAPPKVEKPKE